jgi:Phage tail protein (Tail_P2_I)
MLKTISQNPQVGDIISFDIITTDVNGNLITPYQVNSVTIYFVERDYVSDNFSEFEVGIGSTTSSFFYRDAIPVKVFGDDDYPAWIESDVADAFITLETTGNFNLDWDTSEQREGDYFICWTWMPVPSADTISNLLYFYLNAPATSPAIPPHQTPPDKYATLMERYTPALFKRTLANSDVTPDVINRTNLGIADGFTFIENFTDQIVDLQDANVINEAFLPYLSAYFGWSLKTQDPTLWRRQIKEAIPLYKQKGTIVGLQKALAACGVFFKKLTMYWQVVSQVTWQDGWLVTEEVANEETPTFQLSMMPLLPVDLNYHLYYRAEGTSTYTELSMSDIAFEINTVSDTPCEYNGNPSYFIQWQQAFTLNPGDYLRLVYKVSPVVNQTVETYIQTLPLADQRDETTVTFPVKNWNVRLIAHDDSLFDTICPSRFPFEPDVVFGQVRTEFAYSENIYNMDTYNGSPRDSTDPCDIDTSFYDTCSCCRSSNFSIDVDIEGLSNSRITETDSIISEFVPFHAILQSINYTGVINDLIIEPREELECLINAELKEHVAFTQFDFNRVIIDGNSDASTLKRDMLASATTVAVGDDGIGSNEAVTLYVPGYKFNNYGIATNNLLEILSGPNTGTYTVLKNHTPYLDVVEGSPDTIAFPLDTGAIYFRLSNIQYSEVGSTILQSNVVSFSDPEINFALYPISNDGSWSIQILSGPYTGTYPISFINSDGTLTISGWTGSNVSSLSYQLNSPIVAILNGTTGQVVVTLRGLLQVDLIAETYDISIQDYVLYEGNQYQIISIGAPTSTYNVYISGWNSGNVVGMAQIQILKRIVNTTGYLGYRGLVLTTSTNYETYFGITNASNESTPLLDDNNFMQNYVILIGTTYYQISNIDDYNIYLAGPPIAWGLAGTPDVSYTLIHFEKLPVVNQDNTFFNFIDRRGEGSLFVSPPETGSDYSTSFRVGMLNSINTGGRFDLVSNSEEIWCNIEVRE